MIVHTKNILAKKIVSELIQVIDTHEEIDFIELTPIEMAEAYRQLKDTDRVNFTGNSFEHQFIFEFDRKKYDITVNFIKGHFN